MYIAVKHGMHDVEWEMLGKPSVRLEYHSGSWVWT